MLEFGKHVIHFYQLYTFWYKNIFANVSIFVLVLVKYCKGVICHCDNSECEIKMDYV